MAIIFVKQKRERSIQHKHPWLFSGAIERVEGDPQLGETVEVKSFNGDFLGWGAYSPNSQIRVRFWSFDQTDTINRDFLKKRIETAISLRSLLLADDSTNMYRLIHAESDDLPGLIVDRYADFLVIQILSAGIEYWCDAIIDLLHETLHPEGIYERSDVSVRQLEGLEQRVGSLFGPQPPARLRVLENHHLFWVDLINGQKTGFYIDQRDNRQKFSSFTNSGSVLNCFAYSAAFSVYALNAGAESVLSIDSSVEALDLAKENILLNQLPLDKCEWLAEDVFTALRALRDRARSFDAIILDPPKFAPTSALAQKAARAYKDINLLAFKLLKPGGVLFTFSCSGGIDAKLFQKIVSDAALDAGVNAKIISFLTQGSDHPVSLNFPEGAYLKGLVCKII
ncbi:MAG: class I SAM-dependent rRNA methyltransferase [Chloroflexota bacterium]